MALIRNGSLAEDRWTILADGAAPPPDAGDLIVPLKLWRDSRDSLKQRSGATGVWLDSAEDPIQLSDHVDELPVIAVNFPKFTDGRGYSTARLLRERYQYRGELRAIGDVLRDQLQYMKRCGFDAFKLRADQDTASALGAFDDLSESYQAAVDQPLPLFRRRHGATRAAAPVAAAPASVAETPALVAVTPPLVVTAPALVAAAAEPVSLERRIEDLRGLLGRIERDHAPAALASAFGIESMVLIDLIAKEFRGIKVFTLDTGRLPEETYQLMHETRRRYDLPIEVYTPDPSALARYVREYGVNGFYDGLTERKGCCDVRKVEPLNRALAGKRAWLSGLRHEQAQTRVEASAEEFDAKHGLIKFNPLVDWSEAEVWAYIRRFDVPYNTLLDRGYTSVGCAPCTRPVQAGEHVRAGRWWWEAAEHKECGIHLPAEPRKHVLHFRPPAVTRANVISLARD